MDPNRNETVSCTTQVDDCMKAYNDYHDMIETKFKQEFMQAQPKGDRQIYKMGLVLDIHGQTHVEDWIELGYMLSENQLNTPTLNSSTMKTSVDNLISHSNLSIDDLIRGL